MHPTQPAQVSATDPFSGIDLFAVMLSSCPDAVVLTDLTKTIIMCNEAAARIAGVDSAQALIGCSTDQFLPPDVQRDVERMFRNFEKKGQGKPVLMQIQDIHGSLVMIEVRSVLFSNPDGSRGGVISYFRDVTAIRQLERNVAHNHELHRLITENVGDVIWLMDATTLRFTYVSDSVFKLRGFTVEEVLQQSMAETMTSESLASVQQLLADIMTKNRSTVKGFPTLTTRIDQPCKDGSIVHTEVVTTGLVNDEGVLMEVLGISRDITDRVRMERELMDTKSLLEAAFEQTPMPMVLASASDGAFRIINSAARELLGLNDCTHILGRTVATYQREWIPCEPDGSPADMESLPLILAMQGIPTHQRLMSHRRPDGEQRWELVSASPVYNAAGELIAGLAAFPDLTERMRMEAELRTSRSDLEESLAAKNTFFDIIAHDLKTPFNNILGLSEILVNDLDSLQKDETQQFAENIHLSALRTYMLLENLLDWSQNQTGRLVFRPVMTDIPTLVEEILALSRDQARIKHVVLLSHVSPHLSFVLDPRMVMTILRNLVSNAIKYSPREGRVRVVVKEEGEDLLLEVSDEGAGIEPRNQMNLFTFAGTQSTPGTKGERGTGLGLLLCKTFVDFHGGTITIGDGNPTGTTVRIRFPAAHVGSAD